MTMSTRVFLVRHGATTLSTEDRFAGETDVDLSDTGRDQLRRLGRRLAKEAISAVYASPMRRTLESASLLAAAHGLPVVPVPDLREISHGRWETRTRSDVETQWPEEYSRWESDPYTFAPEGGESGLAVTARALPALTTIVAAQEGKTVLVVSHKATIRLLLSALLAFDPRFYRDRLDQSPACLNVLDFKDASHARLTLFNDISHYEEGAPGAPTAHLSKWFDATKV
jgi:broad specificity phosphatase PhoE